MFLSSRRGRASHRIFPLIAGIVLALTLPSSVAEAAAYIKFGGIDGESMDPGHLGWSDVLSFSHGYSSPSTGGGGAGKVRPPVLSDIVVTKEVDKATPKLALGMLSGRVFPDVVIDFTKNTGSGPVSYFQYELKNVLISGYQVSSPATGGGSTALPTEQLSLNFEEIKVIYTETDEEGNPKGQDVYVWKVSGKK